jgi:type VI protein secretion system component VasK
MPGDPFSSVSVSLDGEVVRSSTGGNVETARIDWPGGQHEAKLSAGNAGPEITMVGPYAGPWAVFQLFNAADDWKPAGNGYRVGWELATRTQRATTATGVAAKIIVQIDAGPAATVLKKGFFAGSECGGDIAR